MSAKLDRAGIFMAKPKQWMVRTYKDSQSVSIGFEFQILAQLEGETWLDWRDFDEYTVWGHFFIVKRDGTVNDKTVEQLTRALGWNGDLGEVVNADPPNRAVQITVKPDEWQGVTTFKAEWMNHKDFVPSPQGASLDDVNALNSRFGSLLRAAAASVKKGDPPPGPKDPDPPVDDDDDLPF